MSQIHNASPVGPDGVVRCYTHSLPAAFRTSRTLSNPNRDFYCCPLDSSDEDRCKFFVWADNPILKAVASMTQTTTDPSSSAPGPSQRQRAEQAQQGGVHSSAQSISLKRSRSPSVSAEPSPSQLRRLEKIEAALMSETSVTPTTPSRASRFRPATITPPSSQQGKSKRFADIQDALEEPLSTMQTQSDSVDNHNLTHHEMTPTRSSKRARTNHIQWEDQDHQNEVLPLTPPPTSHRSRYSSATGSTTLPTRGLKANAKEGDDSNSETGSTMWQNDQDDQENPFHDRTASLRGLSLSHPRNPSDVGPGTSAIPDSELSGDSVASLVEGLAAVPAYVRRLERRLLASQQSNAAKAKEIERLENEIERLKNTNKILEQTIGALIPRPT